jgi:hypothetical protein
MSSIFDGAAAKFLTPNEFKKQHEFQGVQKLRELLGGVTAPVTFPARFLRLGDDADTVEAKGFVTWSDVRRLKTDRSAEYHLYYSHHAEKVMQVSSAGDMLLVAKLRDRHELVIFIIPEDSSLINAVLWLFDLENPVTKRPAVTLFEHEDGKELGWLETLILEELGLEENVAVDLNYAEILRSRFGLELPSTRVFSEFAREIVGEDRVIDDPDGALLEWFSMEHSLFRQMETMIVEDRLRRGFVNGSDVDVDGFVKFSLSVQNRRKSRAGLAFENHLGEVFRRHELKFDTQARTEGKKRPDFLFPGHREYHDRLFSGDRLTLLAAKSTCKDRWRQVLSEARRIPDKHLITMEPGISLDQTNEMRDDGLRLVVPLEIQKTYMASQREWIMSLGDFIGLVKTRMDCA